MTTAISFDQLPCEQQSVLDAALAAPGRTDEMLRSVSEYRDELRPTLPADVFALHPARLWLYAVFYAPWITAILWVLRSAPSWPWKLAVGVLVGVCHGAIFLLTHEVTHGGIVRSRRIQWLCSFIGLTPYLLAPSFWRFWHLRLHHAQTQRIDGAEIHDPDAFPTLELFRANAAYRATYPLFPGSGNAVSWAYLFYWFGSHTTLLQGFIRFRDSQFRALDQRRVTFELLGQIALMSAYAAAIGVRNWPALLVLPWLIQNYFIMSYIATNHSLSPLTKTNDPLVNSLSVTDDPASEWLHCYFGYHVAHHLFPSVNGPRLKAIHHRLVELFPKRYAYMTRFQALRALYSTPRVYQDETTLIDPRTGRVEPATTATNIDRWRRK